jgi:hypothetical protein
LADCALAIVHFLKVPDSLLLDKENVCIAVPCIIVELGCPRACHLTWAEFLKEAESDGRSSGAAAHPQNERIFVRISSTFSKPEEQVLCVVV